jgi:hypothetical protein
MITNNSSSTILGLFHNDFDGNCRLLGLYTSQKAADAAAAWYAAQELAESEVDISDELVIQEMGLNQNPDCNFADLN